MVKVGRLFVAVLAATALVFFGNSAATGFVGGRSPAAGAGAACRRAAGCAARAVAGFAAG